jgi:hypothetical protein
LEEIGLVGGDHGLDAVAGSQLGLDPDHVGAHGGTSSYQYESPTTAEICNGWDRVTAGFSRGAEDWGKEWPAA